MVLALEYASLETGIKCDHHILNSVEFDAPEKHSSYDPKTKIDPRIETLKKYDGFVIAGIHYFHLALTNNQ